MTVLNDLDGSHFLPLLPIIGGIFGFDVGKFIQSRKA